MLPSLDHFTDLKPTVYQTLQVSVQVAVHPKPEVENDTPRIQLANVCINCLVLVYRTLVSGLSREGLTLKIKFNVQTTIILQ